MNVTKGDHQKIADLELCVEVGLAIRLGHSGPHRQLFSSYVLEDGVAESCISLQLTADPLKLRSVFNKDPFKMSDVERVCFLLDKDWKPQLLPANKDKWKLKDLTPAVPGAPVRIFYVDRKRKHFFMPNYLLCLVVLELGLLKCGVPHHETHKFYKQLLSTVKPEKLSTKMKGRTASDAQKIGEEFESLKRKRQRKEVEDTEQEEKSFNWGGSRFTFKANNVVPGAGFYQADCPLNGCEHVSRGKDGKISRTRCRRRINFSDAHEEQSAIRRLKWWVFIAKDFTSKDTHQGEPIDDDDVQDELLEHEPAR